MMGTVLGTVWGLLGENTIKITKKHKNKTLKNGLKTSFIKNHTNYEKQIVTLAVWRPGVRIPYAPLKKPRKHTVSGVFLF